MCSTLYEVLCCVVLTTLIRALLEYSAAGSSGTPQSPTKCAPPPNFPKYSNRRPTASITTPQGGQYRSPPHLSLSPLSHILSLLFHSQHLLHISAVTSSHKPTLTLHAVSSISSPRRAPHSKPQQQCHDPFNSKKKATATSKKATTRAQKASTPKRKFPPPPSLFLPP